MNSISLPLQYSVVCVAGLKNHCSSITIKFLITNRKRCRIKKKTEAFCVNFTSKMSLRKQINENLKETYFTKELSREQTKRKFEKTNQKRIKKVYF